VTGLAQKRTWIGAAVVVALFLVCLVLSLSLGPASLSPGEVLHYVVSGPEHGDAGSTIFWEIRMPRVVLAFLVGAMLAGAGVILQDLFLNPLTDPYVTGVSSGAALGATIAIFVGLTAALWLTGFALIGGFVTLAFVWSAARRRGRLDVYVLLLAGVSVSYLATAIISILMIRSGDDLSAIVYWLMGSFSGRGWGEVRIALFALPFMAVPLFFTDEMNILLQGEKRALELGVEVERTKAILMVTAATLTAIGVSVSGVVGFVGLVIPHVVRLLVGPNHRRLVPFSLMLGAALLGIADLLSRTMLEPSEIPVGVVTTLFGAPVFIYLLRRGRAR
jgi:iron complex transport system permease protein